MITITCTTERQADRYLLVPNKSWRFSDREPVLLTGPYINLWDTLLRFADLPDASQSSLMKQLPRELRVRITHFTTRLAQDGCIDMNGEFLLDTEEAPDNPLLRKLHLEITHRCNFECRACYLGERLLHVGDKGSGEGTTEQWLTVIDDAGKLGCGHATVTGGEPFVRKDILRILDALSDNNIQIEINTNGTPITEEIARRLRDMLIVSVEVTVYGYDNSSGAGYTKAAQGHEASLRGLSRLREQNIPVTAKYFATQATAPRYERARSELEQLGVSLRVIGHNVHGEIFSGKPQADGIAASGLPRPDVVQEHALPCYPSVNELAIEPDGSVRACPKLAVYFGNVFESGLEDVWRKSKDLEAFRAFWLEYCKAAGYVRGATHGSLCPAANLLSRPHGLQEFRHAWNAWQKGSHHHDEVLSR